MRTFHPLPVLGAALLCLPLTTLHSMDKARVETRVNEAVRKFGVAGRNVLVAILDRGVDWKNNDFRNPDGTTRIEGILDLTDSTGATDAKNRFKRGTLYSKQQIDAALAGEHHSRIAMPWATAPRPPASQPATGATAATGNTGVRHPKPRFL